MADQHRRVEPRGVVGSGMLTDPERIEELEHERARVERTWRDGPKRKFGEVLTEVPARSPDEAPDERPRRAKGERDATEAPPADENSDDEASARSPAAVEGLPEAPLPRVPPDPRVARLHALLDERAPPSGRGRRRP